MQKKFYIIFRSSSRSKKKNALCVGHICLPMDSLSSHISLKFDKSLPPDVKQPIPMFYKPLDFVLHGDFHQKLLT